MAATRRKIANAEEARNLIDRLARSGLDRTTFCRKEGIDGRSLNCWHLNLARKRHPAGAETLRVVELAWPQAAARPVARDELGGAMESESRYRVVLADAVIEVDDTFRDDTLARLLAVVRAC